MLLPICSCDVADMVGMFPLILRRTTVGGSHSCSTGVVHSTPNQRSNVCAYYDLCLEAFARFFQPRSPGLESCIKRATNPTNPHAYFHACEPKYPKMVCSFDVRAYVRACLLARLLAYFLA